MPQSAKGKKVVGRLLKLKLGLLLKNGQSRPLFVYFQTINRLKTVDFSGIRTRIVRVEGVHVDHLTTTLVNERYYCSNRSVYRAMKELWPQSKT